MYFRVFLYLSVLITLLGCSVTSSQLTFIKNMVTKSSEPIIDNSWRLNMTGYQSIVYAISLPEGVLFSNSYGDQVLFDGWSVTYIKTKHNKPIFINDQDGSEQRLFFNEQKVLKGSHLCQAWKKEKRQTITRFSQSCYASSQYSNSILVGADRNISMIYQIIDQNYTALTLIKLNL